MSPSNLKRDDLVYPEPSFQLIGCAFEVFNELGYGYSEKTYQQAYAIALTEKKIPFKEQVYFPVLFKEQIIRKSFLDFSIDEKIIIELKKDDRFSIINIKQVLNYLKVSNLKLAILINFGKKGVIYKRIVNINHK